MRVENVIYIYIYMCISLVIFDVSYMLIKYRNNKKIVSNKKIFYYPIKEEILKLKNGEKASEKHKKYLLKKLKNVKYLLEFNNVLSEIENEDINYVYKYLYEIHVVFIELAIHYRKRPDMERAYFAYLISKHGFCKIMTESPLINTMFFILNEKSVYCRENAMKAIYSFGDEALVIDALKIIDENQRFLHKKLLTDGLLSFNGEHERLSNALWNSFDNFSNNIKISIVDYFRFSKKDFKCELLPYMKDENTFIELKYSIIRYYGSMYYKEAKYYLIDIIKNDKNNWEIVAIATTSIALYKDKDTIDILKSMLCNKNWYVRLNAANSLVKMGISNDDISEILNGDDKYAKEILSYCLGISKNKKGKEG